MKKNLGEKNTRFIFKFKISNGLLTWPKPLIFVDACPSMFLVGWIMWLSVTNGLQGPTIIHLHRISGLNPCEASNY